MGQRALAAHVKEKAAFLAEIGLFDLVLVVFVAGAALVHQHVVVFERGVAFVEFQVIADGEGAEGADDDQGMDRAAGQVDDRQIVPGPEVLAEKTARFLAGKLQADRIDLAGPADPAEGGAGADGQDQPGLFGQLPDQILLRLAVEGIERPGIIGPSDHCTFDAEDIESPGAAGQFVDQTQVFRRRQRGERGMEEHIDIERPFRLDDIRRIGIEHRHGIAAAAAALQPIELWSHNPPEECPRHGEVCRIIPRKPVCSRKSAVSRASGRSSFPPGR